MKKIFTLLAALLLTVGAAHSQSFVLLHNQSDGTVTELEEGASYSVGYTLDEYMGVTTLQWNAELGIRFESVVAEFVYEVTIEGASDEFTAQTCPSFGTNCYPLETNKTNSIQIKKINESGTVADLHIEGTSDVATTSPIKVKVRVYEPDFEDEAISCTVLFGAYDQAGISVTPADNVPAEYYDLRGIRLESPANGQIVIRRQGNEVSKTVIR